MDLKLPITIISELSEGEVRATGELDLASGEIRKVQYQDYDLESQGLPVTAVNIVTPSLEDVFLDVVERREQREGGGQAA